MIRSSAAAAKGNRIHYDSEVAGFGIRVTAGDARSFILNYRTPAGHERRYTIGDCRIGQHGRPQRHGGFAI